jgi:hypothetical protein
MSVQTARLGPINEARDGDYQSPDNAESQRRRRRASPAAPRSVLDRGAESDAEFEPRLRLRSRGNVLMGDHMDFLVGTANDATRLSILQIGHREKPNADADSVLGSCTNP